MPSDIEKAEKLSRLQALASPVLGIALLLAHQGVFISWDWESVNYLAMGVWTLLAIAALFLAMGGGFWLVPKAVRELANDDLTRLNRGFAVGSGFVAAMVTAILVFVISPFEPLSAQRAAHMIFSIGVALALIMFGVRESRSLA